MKALFDTHVFLWFLDGQKQLNPGKLEIIKDTGNTIFFSAASYWEICLKISLKKLQLREGWRNTIDNALLKNRIQWLYIEKQHMEKIISLPWHHRDPFDRLLIAQALAEKCTLLSDDEMIKKYDIEVA